MFEFQLASPLRHINTHRRKIWGDIRRYRGRSLLVIISITMGVFAVTVMLSITELIREQGAEDIHPNHISHTHAYVIANETHITAEENAAYLEGLHALPHVTDVEGQAVYPVTWQHSPDAITEDGTLLAFSEPFGEADLESISRVTAGRYPQPGEIAVEQRFADYHEIELGDTLYFEQTGNQEWPVVGFVIHAYFTFTPASPNSTLQAINAIYASYDDAQTIVGFPGLSGIHVRYTDVTNAQTGLNTLIETISNETPYVTVFTVPDDPEADFVTSAMTQVLAAMDALGVIAMLVSGLLVTNVMNTIIVEQRQQIGIMKSLGATVIDVFMMYAGMALVFGVVGTVLGLALAIPAAALAVRSFSSWVYIEGFRLSPLGFGVGAALGVIVPVLVAIIPVWNGTRVSILEAITDRGIHSSYGLSHASRLIRRLPLPTLALQALSNIWRKKSRLTLTGLTLTAAIAAFMGATAMDFSLMRFIEKSDRLHGYEIRINPQQPHPFSDIQQALAEDDAIAAVYPGFSISVGVEGFASESMLSQGSNQVMINGFDTQTPTFHFNLIEGQGWGDTFTQEGAVISHTIADTLKRKVGDPLYFMLNGTRYEYPILGILDYSFDAIFMDWRELAHLAGYTDGETEPLPGIIYVKLAKDTPTFEAIDARIASIKSALTAQGIAATYLNQPEAQQQQAQQADMIGLSFQTMSVIMAGVGAVGLMAVLSMAVFERQKEIGIMRSIGASSGTVIAQFMLEGVLLGSIAWLIGLPLSLMMGVSLLGLLPFEGVTVLYPPTIALVGLAGVVVIAALASLLPAWQASRKTVADILRYQ